jgi:hypothetical protein
MIESWENARVAMPRRHPDFRVDRRAREVEHRAAAAGRDRVLTEVFTPPVGTSPGVAFAETYGYPVANREGMKALEVSGSEPRWAALEEQVAAALGDDRILVWRDVVPDEYVEQMCVLLGHRGHRLGLATKPGTHRALGAAFPECGLVVTSNADADDHMNAIKEAMGHRLVLGHLVMPMAGTRGRADDRRLRAPARLRPAPRPARRPASRGTVSR